MARGPDRSRSSPARISGTPQSIRLGEIVPLNPGDVDLKSDSFFIFIQRERLYLNVYIY
jgi:hypothetical protein